MRIISKIKDFYDYISYEFSDKDDDIVFDRRNSIILTKKDIASFLRLNDYEKKTYYSDISNYLIFQVGCLFYLIEVYDIEYKDVIYCGVKQKEFSNYKMKVLSKWRNYNNKDVMNFYKLHRYFYYKTDNQFIDYAKSEILSEDDKMERAGYADIKDKTFILNETGLASVIDPKEIYLGLDEYFSSLITDREKRESVGITNNEKIVNHGFDKKTSFRSIK